MVYPKCLWKSTDNILWKIPDIILENSRLRCIFLYKLSHVCQVSICILLLLFALGHSIVLELLTENTVLQWLAIEPMSQNNWLHSCGSISGLPVPFCCFRHLLFYWSLIVFIVINSCFERNHVNPLAWLFCRICSHSNVFPFLDNFYFI